MVAVMPARDDCAAMLREPVIDLEAFARAFESVPHAERVAITESIDRKGQEKLWEAAKAGPVTIGQMVPRETGPLREVIFHGKNSLPMFSRFQKRFCRPAEGVSRDELWGYNHQALQPVTGPGYFVAYDSPGNAFGPVAIDYTKIPTGRAPHWPEIHDNAYRLSRFIYNGTIDYMRRVSEHLLIGRATRAGQAMPNWFLLCREDPGR
jgi:hypothetical protein